MEGGGGGSCASDFQCWRNVMMDIPLVQTRGQRLWFWGVKLKER